MNDIVGTWRLVMTRARNDAGEPMHPPYGPQPMGVVVFSPDRRMVAVLCDARAVLPDDEPPATPALTVSPGGSVASWRSTSAGRSWIDLLAESPRESTAVRISSIREG